MTAPIDEMGAGDTTWVKPSTVTFGVSSPFFGPDTAVSLSASGEDGGGAAFHIGALDSASSATIEAWVKPSALPAAGREANIVALSGCCMGYTVAGLRLALTSSGTVVAEAGRDGDNPATGELPPGWDPSLRVLRAESAHTVLDGEWHQVAAVYDNSSRTVSVAVDGRSVTKGDAGFTGLNWSSTPYVGPHWMGIGTPDIKGHVEGFAGAVDEVSLYDKPLSLADIRTDFLASGQSPPGGWRVPEGMTEGSEALGPNAAKDWADLLRCQCVDPVDTGSGNLHMPIAPVVVPGRGPGLDVEMGYNSLAAMSPGSIGYGWSTTLDMRLVDVLFTGRKYIVQETGATVPFDPDRGGWSAAPGYTATLVRDGSDWVFTRNHTEVFRFDAGGRLRALSDQYGVASNTTTVTYPTSDSSSPAFRQASAMTDGAGRSLAIAWSGGRLASITEPAVTGQVTRSAVFTYDASGNLETYKDLSGGTTVFTWADSERDARNHLMTKMRKPRQSDSSKVIENNYDWRGRVEWQEDELNRRTDFAYDSPSAGKTTVTMPPYNSTGDRHVRIDTYVDGIRSQTITGYGSPAQQTTDYEFWPGTNAPKKITDNAGKATTFTQDAATGNVSSSTDPTGRTTRWTYDGFDQVATVKIGEKGGGTSEVVTTVNEYDPGNGRLEKATVASGTADAAVTDYVYGDAAHPEDVTKVIDPMGKEWTSGYNAGTGYVAWSQNPEGERTAYTYNEIGWPKTVTSPRGVATPAAGDYQTSYSYNLTERSTTVTGPTGDKTKTVLNANGNTASVATGASLADITVYSYTDADELAVEDPPGTGQKSYSYFPNGAQRSYTNELGATTSYAYDAGGNMLTETGPDGRATASTYDAVGRVATVRQPVTGATCTAATKVGCIRYFYDAAGRVTGVDYSDPKTADLVGAGGDYSAGVVYDGLGRRTSARSQDDAGSWTETWAWSKRSQALSHTDRNGDATGTSYNADGTIASITYPGSKTVNRGYDDAGRLTSTTDWASRTATFSYDDDSNWTGTAFGTANTDVFGYDQAGRMTSAAWKQGSTVLGSEAYTRPTATKGMVDTLTPTGAAGTAPRDNGYDNRDRLTGTGTGAGGEAFTLDAASNLLKGPGGQAQAFDKAQQLCWTSATGTGSASATMACPTAPADATVFTYDELGRRTTAVTQDEDRRTLGYDQASRLTKAVDDNTGTNDPTADMSDRPVVGDFDGDGQDDVMAYRPGGSNDDPVWWGADRDVFGTSTDTFSVSGDFTPLSGDFDGDGYGDILWYKPGTGQDYVWFWFGRSGGGHTSRAATINTADYTPFTGDFDGDGKTDIYWYRAGTGTDTIWYGDSGADQDDHDYTQQSMNVSGAYRPVAGDFDGDGKDEVFWYGPGSQADSLWDFTSRSAYTGTSKSVSGANYLPVAGDFDGDGDDDVVFDDWTVDGGDTLWWGPGLSSASHLTVSLAAGQLPFAGDFDGDGRDDVFVNQYGAGGDTIWWGTDRAGFSTADTGFAASAVTMAAAYSYGADGTRTAKTVDGTTTEFTYSDNGGLPVLLEQTTGSDTSYLIYGPGDQPIEQINPDGTALWLHHDQLGSVRMATKATDGTEHSRRTYNAYGTVASESVVTAGTKQPLLSYAGQYTDAETGYQYLRARYYDPAAGQFTGEDAMVAWTQEPYGYSSNNPSNATDPSGVSTCGRASSLLDAAGSLVDCAAHAGRAGSEAVQRSGPQVAKNVYHPVRAAMTSPVSGAAMSANGLYNALPGRSTHCEWNSSEWVMVCYGGPTLGNAPATTFGGVINTTIKNKQEFEEANCGGLLSHEVKHVDQWAVLGPAFAAWDTLAYLGSALGLGPDPNIFELCAGLQDGGYRAC